MPASRVKGVRCVGGRKTNENPSVGGTLYVIELAGSIDLAGWRGYAGVTSTETLAETSG